MMRIVLVLLFTACGAPSQRDGGTCDGALPVSCDGACTWRCVDGRWLTESPCQPCACFGEWCARFERRMSARRCASSVSRYDVRHEPADCDAHGLRDGPRKERA